MTRGVDINELDQVRFDMEEPPEVETVTTRRTKLIAGPGTSVLIGGE